MTKIKVEIWSDVMCPFCYIGKRKFEQALLEFENRNEVEIEWKSFQLNPTMKTDPKKNINQYLAEVKGWTLEQAKQMNMQVTQMAREVGLHYDFDKAVVANSFDAHRVAQLAKRRGKGDATEEALFKAYFTEGKNIADPEVLVQLGLQIGLEAEEIRTVLESDQFATEVQADMQQAQQIGVRGVPFYLMNGKFAVSGAQPAEVFLSALTKAATN